MNDRYSLISDNETSHNSESSILSLWVHVVKYHRCLDSFLGHSKSFEVEKCCIVLQKNISILKNKSVIKVTIKRQFHGE